MKKAIISFGVEGLPEIKKGDSIPNLIFEKLSSLGGLQDLDVLCIASKIISKAEGRVIQLGAIGDVTDVALRLAKQSGKDARICDAIIANSVPGTVHFARNGKTILSTPIGYPGFECTAAGIDKYSADSVLGLPVNADESARVIREELESLSHKKIAVIITDSEGNSTFRGALAQPIGSSGIRPIRKNGKNEENLPFFLANLAALLQGQRGKNIPVVVMRNFTDFIYDSNATLRDGIN